MDIREWLEHTATRAPPDSSGDPNIPEFLRPTHNESDRIGRSYRHKRKRASTDSSIIAPRSANQRTAHAPIRAPSPDHVRDAASAVTLSKSHDSQGTSQSPAGHQPVKTYEKRARYKTRVDRYEPKAKKQKKERDERNDRKKPKRRKSHRTGNGGHTTGLVQSFQLKNGPKNNRLTLKPDTSAGLFKHGRASVQMAGRAGGLPDLVFNEMRFLQKPTKHQDEPPEAVESRKPKLKDRKRIDGEEISAYFNHTKVAKVENERSVNKGPKQSETGNVNLRHKSQTREAIQDSPQLKLPEKPFLGFGSKGRQPESKDAQEEDTACYTWSESAPHRSTPPVDHPLQAPTYDVGKFSSRRPSRERRRLVAKPQDSQAVHAAPEQRELSEPPVSGKWIQTRRTRGPALVEVYQPPKTLKYPPTNRTSSPTKTTMQSLPRRPSSRIDANRQESNGGEQNHEEDDSYRTSDILDIQLPGRSYSHAPAFDPRQPARIPQEEKENYDPQSSFSIDRAIGVAREAAAKPIAVVASPALRNMAAPQSFTDVGYAHLRHATLNRQGDAFAVKDRIQLPVQRAQATRGPAQSPQHVPESYRSVLLASDHSVPVEATGTTRVVTPRFASVHQPLAAFQDDEEVLDNATGTATLAFAGEYIFSNSRQVKELVFRTTPVLSSGIFEAQADRLQHDGSLNNFMEEHSLTRTSPERGLSIGNALHSESLNRPHTGTVDDDFAGFWKPNKLY